MLKIAICDNENRELSLLKEIITKVMEKYTIPFEIADFTQGEDLLASKLEFQLIFLDIILDGRNGIDIGNEIYRRNRDIKIIFQTNYRQYCKEAMNVSHAFAYLEKPITQTEVKTQIEEFMESNGNLKELQVEFQKITFIQKGIFEEKQKLRLPIKKIIYFEYLKSRKKIKIITENAEYIYKDTMSNLESKMRPLGFEISCRGILVNLGNVVRIEGYSLLMNNGKRIPLSQRRVMQFKGRMNSYIHGSCN